jgi:hypothetical protein
MDLHDLICQQDNPSIGIEITNDECYVNPDAGGYFLYPRMGDCSNCGDRKSPPDNYLPGYTIRLRASTKDDFMILRGVIDRYYPKNTDILLMCVGPHPKAIEKIKPEYKQEEIKLLERQKEHLDKITKKIEELAAMGYKWDRSSEEINYGHELKPKPHHYDYTHVEDYGWCGFDIHCHPGTKLYAFIKSMSN